MSKPAFLRLRPLALVTSLTFCSVFSGAFAAVNEDSSQTCSRKEILLSTCYILPPVNPEAIVRIPSRGEYDHIFYDYRYQVKKNFLIITTTVVTDPFNRKPPQVLVHETPYSVTENLSERHEVYERDGNEATIEKNAKIFVTTLSPLACPSNLGGNL